MSQNIQDNILFTVKKADSFVLFHSINVFLFFFWTFFFIPFTLIYNR